MSLPRLHPSDQPPGPRRSSRAIFGISCIGILVAVLFLLGSSMGPRSPVEVCTSPDVRPTPSAPLVPSAPPPGRGPGVPDERA